MHGLSQMVAFPTEDTKTVKYDIQDTWQIRMTEREL